MAGIPSAELRETYEDQYATADPAAAGAWRELCGHNKAGHVVELAGTLPERPRRIADIGCGDGVLLGLLAASGVGERREGFEISARAVAFAAARPGVHRVERFDGVTLPVADGAFDLGILAHVLEHVPDPAPLLAEAARACRAVIVEVPLEANRSAGRPAAQRGRAAVGHLHRFARADIRGLMDAAGLRVTAELADPLPRAIQTFQAAGPRARLLANGKWALRAGLFRASPRTAERAFTVHYAALGIPRRAPSA